MNAVPARGGPDKEAPDELHTGALRGPLFARFPWVAQGKGPAASSGAPKQTPPCPPSSDAYLKQLFSGGFCCKLWFTATRRHTLPLLDTVTGLLRIALTEQREELNAHLPKDIVELLAAHAPHSCCVANHKLFWPYPPTLLKVNSAIQVRLLDPRGWMGGG